jgi:hypothetical protein
MLGEETSTGRSLSHEDLQALVGRLISRRCNYDDSDIIKALDSRSFETLWDLYITSRSTRQTG